MLLEFTAFRTEFDTLFLKKLDDLIQNTKSTLDGHQTAIYIAYIKNLATSGKRIRPYNTALAYTVYAHKDWRTIQDTLIGIELIHLMALIHDDIMDNSETRHGVSSAHSYIAKDVLQKTTKEAAIHTSQSIAILLGDLVFAWAYRAFSVDVHSKESWSVIHALVEEVILGQGMDVYNPIDQDTRVTALEKKMLLKTARYTFTRPLLLGAVCAGMPTQTTDWLLDFGDAVGLLFQMQDDIFDITKDATLLKKNPLGDIKNGTHTLLSEYVLQNGSESDKAQWLTWFGSQNIPDQKQIESFMQSVGALDFGEKYIARQEQIALDTLSRSGLNVEDSQKFKSLLSVVTKRTY